MADIRIENETETTTKVRNVTIIPQQNNFSTAIALAASTLLVGFLWGGQANRPPPQNNVQVVGNRNSINIVNNYQQSTEKPSRKQPLVAPPETEDVRFVSASAAYEKESTRQAGKCQSGWETGLDEDQIAIFRRRCN